MNTVTTVNVTRDDLDLVVAFAGCSLDESPGKNWVERSGGLPEYICEIARAIKRSGKTTSQAIAIAVERVKKWAAGADDVNADTRAKAARAVAQWEALKGKNKAKGDAKKVAASRVCVDRVLTLTVPQPGALERIVQLAADSKKPYGNVDYADPGHKDDKKRYPVDTAAHVRAAWSYINQEKNQKDYSPAQVAAIKAKIRAAAKKFNIDISG